MGGVENICQYLAEGMSSHQMAILCFNDKCKDTIDVVNGIKVYRVATWINLARQALSLSYFPMMHKAIKEFKPDIIHFHWALSGCGLINDDFKGCKACVSLAHGHNQTK